MDTFTRGPVRRYTSTTPPGPRPMPASPTGSAIAPNSPSAQPTFSTYSPADRASTKPTTATSTRASSSASMARPTSPGSGTNFEACRHCEPRRADCRGAWSSAPDPACKCVATVRNPSSAINASRPCHDKRGPASTGQPRSRSFLISGVFQEIARLPQQAGERARDCFRDAKTKGPMSVNPLTLMLLDGAPGEIRTPDPQVRSLVLYPAELRAR